MLSIAVFMNIRDERRLVLAEQPYHALLCMDLMDINAPCSQELF